MIDVLQQNYFQQIQYFWQLVDATKASEKYKIDKNLQYLKFAPLPILKRIFIQYRFFTQYYIADLAILISKLPFGQLRSILAEILNEELGSGKAKAAHPELYDCFLQSIGVQPSELQFGQADCAENLTRIQHALLQNSWTYGLGLRGMGGECLCQIYLATMYEFFVKNPSIIAIQNQIEWEFWDIHIGEIDLHHQQVMRAAISNLLTANPQAIQELTAGYIESKSAWDLFWESIFNYARAHHESAQHGLQSENKWAGANKQYVNTKY